MKKQNWIILGIAVLLIAAVFVAAFLIPDHRTLSDDAPALAPAETTVQPSPTPEAVPQETVAPDTADPQANAYLVVTVSGIVYEPIPLAGEGSFTLTQGEGISNTIHVTPDSIFMEHSTCENQDCVDQGTVSLENMKTRVLGNLIICLPNQVMLELHTPESLLSTFGAIP